MNELRTGFSLDGYYMYDDGNRLGVFMKENSGQKYFIYNLELKLEVVDEQFEVARISVKRAIERLPQVENLQRSTSNNMLLYLSITVNTFYNANQVILDLTPVQATKRDLEGRKPIYVVHVNFFVSPARFILYKEGMSGIYGIRHSRSALNELSVLDEKMFPLNFYTFMHGKLPANVLEIISPVNMEYERMVFRFNFSNTFSKTILSNKKNRMFFKVCSP